MRSGFGGVVGYKRQENHPDACACGETFGLLMTIDGYWICEDCYQFMPEEDRPELRREPEVPEVWKGESW